ncbi:MAG: N-6 DNA methylase, partial [Chloroflexota bacterium]
VSSYCKQNKIAQEFAQAFAIRATDLTMMGQIALIINSKSLFNNSPGDKNFRKKLLKENTLETVVNFSTFRNHLFASTDAPATVLIYKSMVDDGDSMVLYCTPKPAKDESALLHITVDMSEIQFIPRNQFLSLDWTWKIAMWGTQRDSELLAKFKNTITIEQYINEKDNWYKGVGLQKPGEKVVEAPEIAHLHLVITDSLSRYWDGSIELKRDKDTHEPIKIGKDFRRSGVNPKELYSKPHVLIKQAQKNKKFCASYVDFDCAFQSSVHGISSDNPESLKTLVAFLNSSFATYFLFLTTATWGVEREIVNFTEMLQLPSNILELPKASTITLSKKVDQICELMAQGFSDSSVEVLQVEEEIDKIIYDSLQLSPGENALIEDVLQYSLDFFQEGADSIAYAPVGIEQIELYAETICKTLNSILRFGKTTVWATVYHSNEGKTLPFNLVSLYFNLQQSANTVLRVHTDLDDQLAQINQQLRERYTENLYIRRHLKMYGADTIDIVKPNEQRFWSRSIAFKDADSILAEGVNTKQP